MRETALPHLMDLHRRTGLTVNLAVALAQQQRRKVEVSANGCAARALRLDLLMPQGGHSGIDFLAARGYAIPAAASHRDVTAPVTQVPELHPVLIDIYRRDPEVGGLCERLVDLDEGIQEWRYRHVKMVERTIGTKPGTGGSAGAAYLMTTLDRPCFPDLWAIRTEL